MNALELAEKLAAAREQVEQAIVKHCPVPLFYADKDGKWVKANAPLERLLAADNDELVGTRWQKLLVDAKTARKEYEAVIRAKAEVSKLRGEFKANDGRLVSAYINLVPCDGAGFVGFVMPVCAHPVDCPIHGFLLHNIESAQVRG